MRRASNKNARKKTYQHQQFKRWAAWFRWIDVWRCYKNWKVDAIWSAREAFRQTTCGSCVLLTDEEKKREKSRVLFYWWTAHRHHTHTHTHRPTHHTIVNLIPASQNDAIAVVGHLDRANCRLLETLTHTRHHTRRYQLRSKLPKWSVISNLLLKRWKLHGLHAV